MKLRPRNLAGHQPEHDDVLGRFIRLLANAIVRRLKRDQARDEPLVSSKSTGDSRDLDR
jgi:hypothetical protein